MEKVVTPEFRASFPAVFKPKAFEGQEPKFNCVMLFDESTDLSGLKDLARKAVEAKWPEPAKRPTDLRNPFRAGSEKPDVEGYAGKIFVNATSKKRPGLVDQNVEPIIEENDFYAGCYARATVTAYAYDRAGNRGVAFGLQNIQKLRDGDAFDGRSKPEDDFAPVKTEGATASASGASASSDDMFA